MFSKDYTTISILLSYFFEMNCHLLEIRWTLYYDSFKFRDRCRNIIYNLFLKSSFLNKNSKTWFNKKHIKEMRNYTNYKFFYLILPIYNLSCLGSVSFEGLISIFFPVIGSIEDSTFPAPGLIYVPVISISSSISFCSCSFIHFSHTFKPL